MAPRTLQLRTRRSTGAYPESDLSNRDYPRGRLLDPPAPGAAPFPYGPSDVQPPAAFPYGPSSVQPPAAFPYGPSDPTPPPAYDPGGGEVAPPAYSPGGGVDMTPSTPLPPSRPSGLGTVLASAVQGAPLPPVRPAAAPQAAPSPFTTITAPNSDPLARNRPQMGALDLSGLLGGLFGGRR